MKMSKRGDISSSLTIQGKAVFCSDQYKNGCLVASDRFRMLTQSIKFYKFHYRILKSTDV